MSEASSTQFIIEVHRDGVLLGSAAASVQPCVEDARFHAVLAGETPNDGTLVPYAVTPLWDEDEGPPVVAGLRLGAVGLRARTYDRDVFLPRARAMVRALLEKRQIERGDTVRWRVLAREQEPRPVGRWRGRVSRVAYPFRSGAVPEAAPGTLRIMVDAAVLDAARAAMAAAPTIEWAALLTGDLVLDATRGAARLGVDGYIPVAAGRRGASESHFAFDASTFLAARRALGDRAHAVGWLHSHPACVRCPDNPTCAVETIFFSDNDRGVMESAFASVFMVGLVVGKLAERPASEPGFRLYGWSEGRIVERVLAPRSGGLATVEDVTTPPLASGAWAK